MAKRRKPTDPAKARAIRVEREANAADLERLTRQEGVQVNVDQRTGQLVGAWRRDVVSMMQDAGAITAETAGYVRKLEALVDEANGRSSSCLSVLDRVTGGPVGDHAIVAHITAARGLVDRQERMDPITWGLLRELCDGNLLITRWRGVVTRWTGEVGDKQQGAIVRQAFRVLAGVEEGLFAQGNVGRKAA